MSQASAVVIHRARQTLCDAQEWLRAAEDHLADPNERQVAAIAEARALIDQARRVLAPAVANP